MVTHLSAGEVRVIGIRCVAVFRVVAFFQQEKSSTAFALANQMAGLQCFEKVQLDHGLQIFNFVVLIHFEDAGAGGSLSGNMAHSYIVNRGEVARAADGISYQFLLEPFIEQEKAEFTNIGIGVQRL